MRFEQKAQHVSGPRVTYEFNILIGGKPITEYAHEGNTFVEGRKGSEFELEFKNHSNKRVLVVPSVDGKSIFDKSPATADSRGYVVRAYGSIRIPGWTLDANDVAKFVFDDKEKSYAVVTAQEGESVQSGVVGVLVYAEVEKPKPVEHHHHHYPRPRINPFPQPGVYPKGPFDPWPYNGPTWTADNNIALGSAADVKSAMRGMTTLSANAKVEPDVVATSATADSTPFEMGAGFGERAQFKTHEVEFERGPLQATMVLYYDSRRNLEKRGIEVVKKETRHLSDLPQAFAGMGCAPPPGWNG